MTMTPNFNKVWASGVDTSPNYPTDTQSKRGLSYLGTEPPTVELHDALFQTPDIKALWLYDQVRIACEKFGQKVQNSDGTLVSDARDTMANAITYALLNQRKADEGGYGIVKMANADQTNAGQEYNLAVSPKHLAEYVATQNTWENTRGKPQTAVRWPYYSEVMNTPALGSSSSLDVDRGHWQAIADTSSGLLPAATFASMRKAMGTAAYHDIDPGAWDVIGNDSLAVASSAHVYGVRENLNALKLSLHSSAYRDVDNGHWGTVTTDSSGLLPAATFAAMRDATGTAAYHDIDMGDWSVVGNDRLAIASVSHIYGVRNYFESTKVSRDNCIAAGFLGGDYQLPHIRAADGNSIILARKDNVDSTIKEINENKVNRDNSISVGFLLGNKYDPYIEHSSGENVPIARQAYLDEQIKSLSESKVTRDNVTTMGYMGGNVDYVYVAGPGGTSRLQKYIEYGQAGFFGTIENPNGFYEQWGVLDYSDIQSSGTTVTITFPVSFTNVSGMTCTCMSTQSAFCTLLELRNYSADVILREAFNGAYGGKVMWRAWGSK